MQEQMEQQKKDPMISYRQFVKTPLQKLKIKEINMSELIKIYKK